MKKSCGKKLWRACVGILLTLAVWITAAPYAVAAETTGDAKSQAQEIRQIQDNIVSWKAATEGEKQLLVGDLLDGAVHHRFPAAYLRTDSPDLPRSHRSRTVLPYLPGSVLSR